MLVVGLTGDVGAGKSTVSAFWETRGAHLIDADRIVSDLWASHPFRRDAAARWGDGILVGDRGVDRDKIASIVFENPVEYRWLCESLHPIVRRVMENRICSLNGWVVADIPLLFEGGVPWWVDTTVYVTAPFETRVERNRHRNWTVEELRRREKHLLPRSTKMKLADQVLDNANDMQLLLEKAREIGVKFSAMASCVEIELICSRSETAEDMARTLVSDRLATDVLFYDALQVADGCSRILKCKALAGALTEIKEAARSSGCQLYSVKSLRGVDMQTLLKLMGARRS